MVFLHISWGVGHLARPVILLEPGCQLGGCNQGHYPNLVAQEQLPELPRFHLQEKKPQFKRILGVRGL